MRFNDEFVKSVRTFIKEWDKQHPIDYVWRIKHNIPFGSKEHLEVSFIDQLIWYEEDKSVQKQIKEYRAKIESGEIDRVINYEEDDYSGGGVDISQSEIEAEFENLDIDSFNEK